LQDCYIRRGGNGDGEARSARSSKFNWWLGGEEGWLIQSEQRARHPSRGDQGCNKDRSESEDGTLHPVLCYLKIGPFLDRVFGDGLRILA
jgi:hypothetical protein